MSASETSEAAVARADILLTNQQGMEAFLAGNGSKYGILRTAGTVFCDGPMELNFDGPDMFASGDSAVSGRRAPGATFTDASPGTLYTANLNPTDLGKSIRIDKAQGSLKQRMRLGSSWDDIIAWAGLRSFSRFVEQIELLGVVESGGIGHATSPFDSTLCADYDAGSSGSGLWDVDTSNPVLDVKYVANSLKNSCGTIADTIYMSTEVARHLSVHPAMVSMYGGNVGQGGLSEAEMAAAFGLRQLITIDNALIGEYVTVCRQGAPGDIMMNPNDYTIIYGFDPADGDLGMFGVNYLVEGIPGTGGQAMWVTASSYCGVAVNPIGGRRISNTLT